MVLGERVVAQRRLAAAEGAGDIGHQLEVLDLVRRLNRERGPTLALVLHDLNQAARYADRLVALDRGAIVADDAPEAVLTIELLAEVSGVRAHIIADPESGTPVRLPHATVDHDTDGVIGQGDVVVTRSTPGRVRRIGRTGC